MSLNAALTLLLETYETAKAGSFANNPVASFIRQEIPAAIRQIVGPSERYVVQGSPGQGNWAGVPWVAVFDRLVTESAQDGYYLVYLVKEDLTGIYLSLNQGVTTVRAQYGAGAKEALRVKSSDYLARLGLSTNNLLLGPINLALASTSSLGGFYEQGAICSIHYPRIAIPTDQELSIDLRRFLEIYLSLTAREPRLYEQADAEDDEANLGHEDLRRLREHKRIERNKKLAARAKQVHGYKCKACGFDFEERYGSLGARFIEAHHLSPLGSITGELIALDARRDFTVLCSNCHRMIHRSEFAHKVEEFRAAYVVNPTPSSRGSPV